MGVISQIRTIADNGKSVYVRIIVSIVVGSTVYRSREGDLSSADLYSSKIRPQRNLRRLKFAGKSRVRLLPGHCREGGREEQMFSTL